MNSLQKGVFFLFVLILSLGISSCSSRFNKSGGINAEKKLYSKSAGKKIGSLVRSGIELPGRIIKGFRDRKLEREYQKSIMLARKRAFEMQTPEVQKRMLEDKLKTELHYKERQKKRKEKFKKPEIEILNADVRR
jgi:hypothetical protein